MSRNEPIPPPPSREIKKQGIISDFIEIPANNLSIAKRKPIYNIATNDSPYMIEHNGKQCAYYKKWKNMLERCYDPKYHEKSPTYKNANVCDEWLNSFMAFKAWMIKQDHHEKQLDKDLLIPNNKHYSPKTCLFTSQQLNLLLSDRSNDRGQYKIGVCLDGTHNNRFKTRLAINGKRKHLGSFTTENEAHHMFCEAKGALIDAIIYTNPYHDTPQALQALKQYRDEYWKQSDAYIATGMDMPLFDFGGLI